MDTPNLSILIERNLIKKRFVLCQSCELDHETLTHAELPKSYELRVNPETRADLLSQVGLSENTFQKRLEHPNISLYAIFFRDELAALYWSLHPTEPVWHDKFLVKSGTAFLFGAYVAPRHRRKGLYLQLIEAAHQDMLNKGIGSIFTIVEASNLASLAANRRCGLKITMHNYLIKMWGRNIVSIYRDLRSGKITLDYVFRTAKSHHF